MTKKEWDDRILCKKLEKDLSRQLGYMRPFSLRDIAERIDKAWAESNGFKMEDIIKEGFEKIKTWPSKTKIMKARQETHRKRLRTVLGLILHIRQIHAEALASWSNK